MLIFLKSEILSQMSFEAIGVLSTMVNVPECDYCTLDELCKKSPDSKSTLQNTLDELISKNYIIKTGNKYAVNKAALISDFSCK